MMTRHLWMRLLAGTLLTSPVLAQSQAPTQEATPAEPSSTARTRALFLLKRHVRAVGGEDVIRAIEFITIRGSVEIGGAAFIGSVESMRSEPPRLLTRLELGPLGKVVQGYDGQIAWSINPNGDAVVLEGPEATSMIRTADVHADLRYEEIYPTIEFTGEVTFEGEPAFAVRLIDHNGVETTEYYSQNSGLRMGVSGTRESGAGVVPYTRVFTDYAEHERFMVPMTAVERVGAQVITVRLKQISFDRLDPSIFEAPEPVRTLLEARSGDVGSGNDSP